ncbi:hypothetical protein KCU78_g3741, partial [Aureobasidium melanogenum]
MSIKEWSIRLNKVVDLFNDEQLPLAEKEARALLNCTGLPDSHRIRCQILLAKCVDDWYEAKMLYDSADHIWGYLRMMETPETKNEGGDKAMNRLRRMLDELNTDLLAEKPDDNYLDGVVVYQPESEDEEQELSAESEEGDTFEEDVEMTDQKEKESQGEEEETFVIESDGVDFDSPASNPTKLKHSASVRSSRTRSTFFESTAPAAAKAAPVSVQAESSRSRSQPMAGTAQSELPRAHSTPLLGTSQNVGPIQKDGQTAAQESLRSSLKDSLNSGWTGTKSGISSTIGTLGRTLVHRSKRRPDSIAEFELGDDSREGSTADLEKRHKRKKDKKSSPALDTVFDPPPRK